MLDTFTAMIKDDEGATLVEYGLVVSLIAVAAIGALTTVGKNVTAMFNSVAGQINP